MADLEIFSDDGELFVDSRLIAERLGIQHESFIKTLDTYQKQMEQAFGIIRFEIGKTSGPGRPSRYAFLKEDQSTFVMTLSANSPQVVQCKIDLVTAFEKAKKLLNERQPESSGQLPYWYKRIRLALTDNEKPLEAGYFCIYQEMLRFFAELEGRLGYVVPDIGVKDGKYLIPDISVGLKFGHFLRSEDEAAVLARKRYLNSEEIIDFRQPGQRKEGWFEGGKNCHEIKIYNHVYPSDSHGKYQVQEANSYPTKYLSILQYFLQEWWIPDNFLPYLKKKDASGVQYLVSGINDLPPSVKQSLSGTLLGKLMRSLPPAQ